MRANLATIFLVLLLLSPWQRAEADKLRVNPDFSAADLEVIDRVLFSNFDPSHHHEGLTISLSLIELRENYQDISSSFLRERLRQLINEQEIVYQADLNKSSER